MSEIFALTYNKPTIGLLYVKMGNQALKISQVADDLPSSVAICVRFLLKIKTHLVP